MKYLILILLLITNIAQVDELFMYDVNNTLKSNYITQYKTNGNTIFSIDASHSIQLSDKSGKIIGTIDFSDGIVKFTGNADESAKVFIEYLKEYTSTLNSICPH